MISWGEKGRVTVLRIVRRENKVVFKVYVVGYYFGVIFGWKYGK